MNEKRYIDKFVIWHESDDEKLPDVSFVPPMMRRRMTNLEKIAIGLAGRVMPDNTDYTTIFASQFGEWEQTVQLIKQFHDDAEMSPAGFSNSVHNAAAGAFSLITKNTNSYTAIAAGKNTLEMAILRAILEPGDTLVVFAAEHCPEMYDGIFDGDSGAHGMAFMMKKSGAHDINVSGGDEHADALTMDKFADFLNGKINSITNKTWTMKND